MATYDLRCILEASPRARKKVLFLYPHVYTDAYAESKLDAPDYPSLTIAVLAGLTRELQHELGVTDLYAARDPIALLKRDLAAFRPDVVAVSFSTVQADPAAQAAQVIKQFDDTILIVGGGVHATALPEETLAGSCFDAVVRGEGEIPFALLLSGEPFNKIPGLVYRRNGTVVMNPLPPWVEDLDSLPIPYYGSFNLKKYRSNKHLWKSSECINIETSRGCPYSCRFCVSNLVFGRKFRAKSAERVHEEMEILSRLGFREIHVQDDEFTIDLRRATRILETLIQKGPRFDIELFNGVRTERLSPEFLRLARRAGCYRIRIGIESADRKILGTSGKSIDLKRIPEVIATARSFGIEVIVLFVLGLPGETRQSFQKTMDFATSCGADLARLALLVPFPGSEIYKQWQAEGRLSQASYSDYFFHNIDRPLFYHPNLSHKELKDCYEAFYRTFYFRPAFALRQIVFGIRRRTLLRYMRYFLSKFIGRPLAAQVSERLIPVAMRPAFSLRRRGRRRT